MRHFKYNIFLIFITLLLVLSGCLTSKKYYQQGEYALSVQKSVKKIQKNRGLKKEIPVLLKAYPKANQKDEDRIKFLKTQGTPDIWDEVFELYSNLKARQEFIRTILPLKYDNKTVDFPVVDYDIDIIDAKKRASEYYYVHAQKLLQQNDKESARQAYSELSKIKTYFNTYKDDDSLAKIAKYKGMTRVIIDIKNKSNNTLPNDFLNNLVNFNINNLNSKWVEYYINSNNKINFDYCIYLTIKTIVVLPEKIKETHYTQSKEIEDGWEYELDRNGNVKKDTSGNDIKRPKIVTISCNITELHQHKEVHIDASVDYFDIKTNNIVLTKPIEADQFYDYIYAVAFGDLRAVTTETRKIIGLPPQAFPTDMNMIYSAGDIIKKLTIDVLRDNKYFIK